jgi:hypothetical protein
MKDSYVICNRRTGKPLHLNISSNEGADSCGKSTYTLINGPDGPLFIAETIEEALAAIATSPEWYNSSAKRPEHGRLIKEDLIIKKINLQDVSYRVPFALSDINAELIYDIHDLSDKDKDEFKLPKNTALVASIILITPGDIEKIIVHIGEEIWIDNINKSILYAICPISSVLGKKIYFGGLYSGNELESKQYYILISSLAR